jgi:hypothetical protein
MIFDRRLKTAPTKPDLKPVELPLDYLKMVEESIQHLLAPGLLEMKKSLPVCNIKASGALYSNEVLLAITLSHGEKNLIATTVYASSDFNPMNQEPGLEAILDECLDSAGSIFSHYLDPKHPERITQLASASIGSLEEAPFEWTPMEDTKINVWVKIDKSNPALESLTEDWLKKNDPNYLKDDETEEAENFLSERLEAINKAKSGSGHGGDSGPIRH